MQNSIILNTDSSRKIRAAQLSICSNTLLVITKLVVGVFTGAVSIISEALHSAVDLMAAVIAYFAVQTSSKPPDEKHPFGHGKIENISGAIEAILIIGAALVIIYEASHKLDLKVMPQNIDFGIFVMLLSIIVNILVSRHLFKVAKETNSHALEADALHLQADVWTSVGVLGGLVAIKVTGLYWLDPLIAIIVAGIIFKAGYKMTKKSLGELMDEAMNQEEQEDIVKIFKAHEMVYDIKNLKTRRVGNLRVINVIILVDNNLHLDVVHSICDELEFKLREKFSPCDISIHAEPKDKSICKLAVHKK